MAKRDFMELLQARWDEGKFVCVGLDSDADKIDPVALQGAYTDRKAQWYDVGEFNKQIIEKTADLVCAYKPNSAFYEALGMQGIEVLELTIDYIREAAPQVPVILDFKRGDIGNTNAGYVRAARSADAVTVHPYLGAEAMKPFLDQPGKGVFVLCKTSNDGGGEFQDLETIVYRCVYDDYVYSSTDEANRERRIFESDQMLEFVDFERVIMPFYQFVAERVTQSWEGEACRGLVVGATYPKELEAVRDIVGDTPILIPGIGAQGGDLEATVKAGANSKDQGMIINSSRGIIFADDPRKATQELSDQIIAALAA